jgi:DNA-binding response OmpR family regulator
MNNSAKKIFIADDDPDILDILKLMLQTRHYSVTTTTNANDIFNYSSNELPDLVLLDIWMCGLDGRDICERLKKEKRTKDIPVIFISANSNIEEITKEYNANGFVAKPFEMNLLLDTIDKSLEPA